MGPVQASVFSSFGQGAGCGSSCRGRPRVCLLKGCERQFRPSHPLQRFCGSSCRKKAREWRVWKAQRKYRNSFSGRERRKEQSRRRRSRLKDQRERIACSGVSVGHRLAGNPKSSFCDRPGCYEIRQRTLRSPLKRFCSSACRIALRRVRLREAYYRTRYARAGPGAHEFSPSSLHPI